MITVIRLSLKTPFFNILISTCAIKSYFLSLESHLSLLLYFHVNCLSKRYFRTIYSALGKNEVSQEFIIIFNTTLNILCTL